MKWLLVMLLAASSAFADEEIDYDDTYDESQEYQTKRLRADDYSESSYLRDEAHWPSQNQDPFLESLSR